MAQRLGLKPCQGLTTSPGVLDVARLRKRPEVARLVAEATVAAYGARDLGEVDLEPVLAAVAVSLIRDEVSGLGSREPREAQSCLLPGDGHRRGCVVLEVV